MNLTNEDCLDVAGKPVAARSAYVSVTGPRPESLVADVRYHTLDQRWSGAVVAMHDTLHVHTHVGVFEPLDRLTAAVALRKHREDVSRELLQLRVVGAARKRHGRYSSPPSGRPPA